MQLSPLFQLFQLFFFPVAHHVDCTIPHYEAQKATNAIRKAFPDLYLYESTPIHKALWRVASSCFGVEERSVHMSLQCTIAIEQVSFHALLGLLIILTRSISSRKRFSCSWIDKNFGENFHFF